MALGKDLHSSLQGPRQGFSVSPHGLRQGLTLKSWSGRMLVVEVVPMQCSKLFKGMECAVLSMALCTIKNP